MSDIPREAVEAPAVPADDARDAGRLSDDENRRLSEATGKAGPYFDRLDWAGLLVAVESILAARLAKVEAETVGRDLYDAQHALGLELRDRAEKAEAQLSGCRKAQEVNAEALDEACNEVESLRAELAARPAGTDEAGESDGA